MTLLPAIDWSPEAFARARRVTDAARHQALLGFADRLGAIVVTINSNPPLDDPCAAATERARSDPNHWARPSFLGEQGS
jgi:hypothetical protein